MTGKEKTFVWKIDGDTVRLTPVKTGATDGFFYVIRSGLKNKDRIVTDGEKPLAEGSRVRIFECPNCS
jgi:multidrug efflux pump subunit AcrA (membrane-fusion protein)